MPTLPTDGETQHACIQQSERVKNGRRKKREGEEVEGDLRLGRKRVNMGISETCACGESIHV